MNDNKAIWKILEEVCDPEIPVLSVIDLGIVRKINLDTSGVEIVITPTYSGCPALKQIEADIKSCLLAHGYTNIWVNTTLSPAWTTDWMSEAGKIKLKNYGIAPPHPTMTVCNLQMFQEEEAIQCPQCNSYNTQLVSRFGSTACKALYRCNDCSEPFDYFKCH